MTACCSCKLLLNKLFAGDKVECHVTLSVTSNMPFEVCVCHLYSVERKRARIEIFLICFPQILTRRIRFRLERAPGEGTLIDRTGKCLKMEPLTTIADLERYLLKMVAKQWYDFERHTFNFVKQLKEPVTSLTFTHQSDFDENGLIYWIGTNAK